MTDTRVPRFHGSHAITIFQVASVTQPVIARSYPQSAALEVFTFYQGDQGGRSSSSSSAIPALSLGFTVFWWDFCVCDFFLNPTIEVVTFRLRGWCMLGVVVASIHPSRTRMSGSAMEWMSTQTGSRFILSFERVFQGMESEPMLTPKEKSLQREGPKEGRTWAAVTLNAATPTLRHQHCQQHILHTCTWQTHRLLTSQTCTNWTMCPSDNAWQTRRMPTPWACTRQCALQISAWQGDC